jgi:septum site-determining protein MinC
MSTIKNQYFSSFVYQITTMNFDLFRKQLSSKIKEAPELFKNSSLVLDFGELNKYEDFENFFLKTKVLLHKNNMFLTGVINLNEKFHEITFKNKVPILHNNKRTSKKNGSCQKYDSHEGVMRSGQELYIPDNGVIYTGHIKNDAEISADGDIIIAGTLSGKAIAGYSGNRDAKIIVTNYQPYIISIAGYAHHYEKANHLFGKSVMVTLNKDNSLKFSLI